MAERAQLSYVVATDCFETIRPVVDCLAQQTAKDALEVVLVAPPAANMAQLDEYRDQFAQVTLVSDPVADLAVARAAGVRAVSAPLLFIGETHSFPEPHLVETILRAFEGSTWACVVPAVRNANPDGAQSWSGYLLDYGRWAPELPSGEIDGAPIYNAAYRSEVLLDLGERLPFALGQTDELGLTLAAKKLRILFEPSTCVFHANLEGAKHWFLNRLLGGALIASNRSRTWSLGRRAVYVGGSFLIPWVLWKRMADGVAVVRRKNKIPAGTGAAVALGLILRAVGEAFAYLGFLRTRSAEGMHHYEVQKLRYVPRLSI